MDSHKTIRFRQSREALILDLFLFPIGVVYSVLSQGFPATWKEIISYPERNYRAWINGGWFTKQLFYKKETNG